MAWSLNALHRSVRWDANFQRPPRRPGSQLFQGVPDRHGDFCLRRTGRVGPPSLQGLLTLFWRNPAASWHGVHGGIIAAPGPT